MFVNLASLAILLQQSPQHSLSQAPHSHNLCRHPRFRTWTWSTFSFTRGQGQYDDPFAFQQEGHECVTVCAHEWTVVGLIIMQPSLISFLMCVREFSFQILACSAGSSQILCWPTLATLAARRFCDRKFTTDIILYIIRSNLYHPKLTHCVSGICKIWIFNWEPVGYMMTQACSRLRIWKEKNLNATHWFKQRHSVRLSHEKVLVSNPVTWGSKVNPPRGPAPKSQAARTIYSSEMTHAGKSTLGVRHFRHLNLYNKSLLIINVIKNLLAQTTIQSESFGPMVVQVVNRVVT